MKNTGKRVICDKGKRIVSKSSGFVRATPGQKVPGNNLGFVFVPFSFDLSQTINHRVIDWNSVKCFVCLFYRLKETTPFYNTGFWIFLSWWVGTRWALSIQPKILEISVGTSNEKDHFGLVRTGIFGTSFEGGQLWPVWLFRSVGRTEMFFSIWQHCCPKYRSFVSCLQEQ